MELRHLRYLVAIADAGAFVRAAERLRVAQPALTRQMHDLEEELGAALFDPAARRATLTQAGDACVHLARHVMRDTEQAVARARLSNSGVIGRCVIASGPLPLVALIPEFLARMRARFPGITIVVEELAGQEQWNALTRAEADIGVGIEPAVPIPELSTATQYLHAVDRVAIAAANELAQRRELSLADLLAIPFLTTEAGVVPAFDRIATALQAAMREQGLPAETLKVRQFASIESVAAHVRAGQGWTLVPSTMSPLLSGIALVKLAGFQAVLPNMRIWRRIESRPAVITVLDQLRRFQENRDEGDAKATAPATLEPEVVPPRIELRHLRSFLAVAEHGSLGRAAEVIGVTQPALSRQMRELEYDVGVALFNRESRGMEITAAGETFRDDVNDLLSVVEKIPREVRRAERARAQRCVIAVVPHPAVDTIVARTVADLEARGDRVRVGTRLVTTVEQARALHAGEVDVALGHAYPVPDQPSAGEHLLTTNLFEDRISVALFPERHALVGRAGLHAGELADIPFVWTPRDFHPGLHDVIFARFAAAGLRPRVDATYDGLATIWSLVLKGGGWTLGWKSHLREPPPGLVAVPLIDFDLPWGVVMSYRQDESRVSVLATIDALVAHASGLSSVKAPHSAFPPSHISEAPIP